MGNYFLMDESTIEQMLFFLGLFFHFFSCVLNGHSRDSLLLRYNEFWKLYKCGCLYCWPDVRYC
jgi:hypothetical protein